MTVADGPSKSEGRGLSDKVSAARGALCPGNKEADPKSQKADSEVIFEESGVRGGGDFSLKRWPKLYVLLERRRWEEDGGIIRGQQRAE